MSSTRAFPYRQALQALSVLTVLVALVGAPIASAQEAPRDTADTPRDPARASISEGMFMVDVVSPAADRTSPAVVYAYGGYDGPSEAPKLEVVGDIEVVGPVDLRLGIGYGADIEEGGEEQEAQPHFGVRVRALSQSEHGLDAAILVGYRMDRFTDEEGLANAILLFGRSFGPLSTFANVGYGQDLEGDDREAEVALGLLLQTTRDLNIGIESRARFDLFSDDEKRSPDAGPLLDWVAGPTLQWALGPLALFAQAGVHTAQLDRLRTGVIALAGLGYAH